ncbi:MAG TPA: type II toxin-antitoxin system RelE/ParE family toxin [Desulfohalobiaceae bacterium]|nr:type II toxin-antitoxin system RelE/ParE family toxin [Desulfohalobiaceae bacterium]
MKQVRFLDPAQKELVEASYYYEIQVSGLGAEFISAIEEAVSDIVKNPASCPLQDFDLRKYVVQRFPFNIIYRNDSDEIVLIAVAHQKRRPFYWVNRI